MDWSFGGPLPPQPEIIRAIDSPASSESIFNLTAVSPGAAPRDCGVGRMIVLTDLTSSIAKQSLDFPSDLVGSHLVTNSSS